MEDNCMNKVSNAKILLTNQYANGNCVNIREVEIEDAEFILSLRCDDKKSKFLNKTQYDLDKQMQYIRHYKTLTDEYYFIITNKANVPLGTIRIYDMQKDTFVSGSWLMIDNSPTEQVLEGNYLALNFAHKALGYEKFCCDVRKDNEKVVRFHKAMGAKIVGENDKDFFFESSLSFYICNMQKLLQTNDTSVKSKQGVKMQSKIEAIIISALKNLADEFDSKELQNPTPTTQIYGSGGGALDSLGLVSFIADLEEMLSEIGINIVLADEKTMSARNSPFRDVNTLVQYILEKCKQDV